MQSENNANWQFEVSELWKNGGESLVFDLRDVFEFAPDDHALALTPVTGEVEFRKVQSADLLVIMRNLQVEVGLACVRCLENFSRKIEIPELSEVFYAWSDDPEDWLWDYENGQVGLYDFLREQIILRLPALPVCKESCQGLCPYCGKNLNREKCDCAQNKKFKKASPFDGLEKLFSREK